MPLPDPVRDLQEWHGRGLPGLDTKLDRDVAVKVLPATLSGDPDLLARFEREAQALAQVNHPGIASIYALESRALVMEFVPGPTLAERIAQGPVPAVEAAQILLRSADALGVRSGARHRVSGPQARQHKNLTPGTE